MERDPDQPALSGRFEATRGLAWAVLTSPRTLVALLVGLGALLLAAAHVRQGASTEALLAALSHSAVRAIDGLSLADVLAGWLTVLLLVLLALNLAGIYLRRVVLAGRDGDSAAGNAGAFVDRAEASLDAPIADVAARLAEAGARVARARGGQTLRGTVGRPYGAIAIAFGVVCLVGGWYVDEAVALDNRVILEESPASGTAVAVATYLRRGDGWVERDAPLPLTCSAAEANDPRRWRRCRLEETTGAEELVLVKGRSARLSGMQITPIEETRQRVLFGGPVRLLVRKEAGATPELLDGTAGSVYELSDGTRLSVLAGPDGPLVLVRAEGQKRTLLAPAVPASGGEAAAGGLLVDWSPQSRIELRAKTTPGIYLIATGLIFVVLGLLLVALLPFGTVVVRSEGERCHVRVSTYNGRMQARRLVDRLVTGGAA